MAKRTGSRGAAIAAAAVCAGVAPVEARADWPSTPLVFTEPGVAALVAGDLDRDGAKDLVIALTATNTAPARIAVLWGPDFVASTDIGTGSSASQDLALADYDVDGRLDVVVGDDDTAWIPNLGGRAFGARASLAAARGTAWVAAADLDADGDVDIVSDGTNGVDLFLNDGTGALGAAQNLTFRAPSRVAALDLDGDRDMDVVYVATTIGWAKNTGGTFGLGLGLVATTGNAFAPFDIERDRDLDLATVPSAASPAWYLQAAVGVFGGAQYVVTPYVALTYVASGDLDSDGDVEPVYGGSDGVVTGLSLLDNLGGALGAAASLGEVPEGGRVVTADLDGDADIDIAVGGTVVDHAEVWILTNVDVVDTDHDGLSDVAEATFNTDPANPDSDGGGALDGDEVHGYYDPNDPADDPLTGGTTTTTPPPETGDTGADTDTDTDTDTVGPPTGETGVDTDTDTDTDGNPGTDGLTDATSTGSSSDAATDGVKNDEGGGCGCATGPTPIPWLGVGGFGLAAAATLRTRRRPGSR